MSAVVLKKVAAAGFTAVLTVEGIVPALVDGFLADSVLAGELLATFAAASRAAFFFASRMASSRARRMAAAIALPSF